MYLYVEILLGTLAKESIEVIGRSISFLSLRYPFEMARLIEKIDWNITEKKQDRKKELLPQFN